MPAGGVSSVGRTVCSVGLKLIFRVCDMKRSLLVTCVVVSLGLVGAGGCMERKNSDPYFPKAPEPGADMAMGYRNFPPSSAVYENTAVIAWDTRAPIVVDPGLNDGSRLVVEPVIFLANVVISPVSFAMAPPFYKQVAYRGGGVESTFSGAPPYDAVEWPGTGPVEPRVSPKLRAMWQNLGDDVKDNFGGDDEGKKGPSTRPSGELKQVEGPAAVLEPVPETAPAPAPKAGEPAMPITPPGDRGPLAPAVEVTPVPTTQK